MAFDLGYGRLTELFREPLAIPTDKDLSQLAVLNPNAVHRHAIEKFVAQNASVDRVRDFARPENLRCQRLRLEQFTLPRLRTRNPLDDLILDRFEEPRRPLSRPAQDIAAKRAVSGARFRHVPPIRRAHRLPQLPQLPSDHRAEDRAHFRTRKIVSSSAHRLAARTVI